MCLWIFVWCHSIHTPFLVAAPGVGMFCSSGMQLMWPTTAGIVCAHWLAHLQLLLAGDCSEGGSQGRWLLLHVLINLEVTVQRGFFIIFFLAAFCCGEVTRIQLALSYKCVFISTLYRQENSLSNGTHNQVIRARENYVLLVSFVQAKISKCIDLG